MGRIKDSDEIGMSIKLGHVMTTVYMGNCPSFMFIHLSSDMWGQFSSRCYRKKSDYLHHSNYALW